MKTSSRLLIILAAIILYSTGVLTGVSVVNKRDKLNEAGKTAMAAAAGQSQTASVLIDTGKDVSGYQNISLQADDTVWSVLDKLGKKYPDMAVGSDNYKDMGVLVKAIKGYANGTGDEYWQYWVNNKYADVAADKQAVKAGDVIMWKFTKAQFKEY